jgi:hypothetical protein
MLKITVFRFMLDLDFEYKLTPDHPGLISCKLFLKVLCYIIQVRCGWRQLAVLNKNPITENPGIILIQRQV